MLWWWMTMAFQCLNSKLIKFLNVLWWDQRLVYGVCVLWSLFFSFSCYRRKKKNERKEEREKGKREIIMIDEQKNRTISFILLYLSWTGLMLRFNWHFIQLFLVQWPANYRLLYINTTSYLHKQRRIALGVLLLSLSLESASMWEAALRQRARWSDDKVYFHCLAQWFSASLISKVTPNIRQWSPYVLLLSVVCVPLSFFNFTCNSSRFRFNQTHCPLLIENKLFAILKCSFEWPIRWACVTK